MPNPFPGMNPWLEAPDLFPDLHASFIYLMREALNAVMPPEYAAIGNQLVWIDDSLRREPDVSILAPPTPPRHSGNGTSGHHESGGGVTTLPRLSGLLSVGEDRAREPWEAPYLEIRADRGQRLVTAIEILSPSNKIAGSTGRKAYLDKQEELRLGGVHLVEFDLLRTGTHTTSIPLWRLQKVAGSFDYHISVRVSSQRDRLYAAPIQLADRLPSIAIPLDRDVTPVMLDLQPLFDRAYDTGRYGLLLRYDQPPDPPLTPEQTAWANEILRTKGLLPPTNEG